LGSGQREYDMQKDATFKHWRLWGLLERKTKKINGHLHSRGGTTMGKAENRQASKSEWETRKKEKVRRSDDSAT